MILERASIATLRLAGPLTVDDAFRRGAAAFPRRPVAFLWHYIRRRPLLHFSALTAVLGAAVCACAAQYGLKLIVDAMAQAAEETSAVWGALAVFAGLLAGESVLWHLVAALCLFMMLGVAALAFLGHRGTPRHHAYADRAAEVGGTLVDVVSNIWVVKAFSAHSRERRRFAQLLETEATAHRGSLMYIEGMRVLHDLSLWLTAVGMLVWNVILWSRGTIRRAT